MSSSSEWPGPATPAAPQPGPYGIDYRSEDPPWNGWDVLRLGIMMFVVPYLLIPVTAIVAQRLFYRGLPWVTVAEKPWVALSTQFSWYVVVAAYMVMFVEATFGQRFWSSIRWNWPGSRWPALVPVGVVLVSLQGLERFFKIPKHIPMEDFLRTPFAAVLTAIFAVSFGPLMEELFFRGFLYPVIARRFGIFVGVLATSVAFGMIHAAQLAFAWGLVLIVFLVGIVLTVVRARTGSVGSSFVVHVTYNATLVVIGLIASRQFAR
ncbi:MAG: CPBP family intramembrane metalloprotease [Acidobacteria bacterium]|nr:CPBP family intramembrane metalloprotease [Acidobacteriota bacterium]MBV9626078.1 CPBP family intramembrane metalloprotease [Acidobacteriota bacterium]